MDASTPTLPAHALSDPSREALLHALYEAAELEHNLMCTYLYAAFSLRSGEGETADAERAAAIARWRREIVGVAIDEMSHLAAVWNITAALGGTPRFGRTNFPLDPGYLPAGIVVKLAPFDAAVLQHFVHLERPAGSDEPDGEGFAYERRFTRAAPGGRLTPTGLDYATVGEFYAALAGGLRALVARVGDAAAFCGDPALQLSASEVDLPGARVVTDLASALAAIEAIVVQGEGAPEHAEGSHFDRFCQIRAEHRALQAADPAFSAAFPAATNPVLRRPPRPEGRVWIEAADAVRTVDLANAAYGLMLRLLAHAYAVPAGGADKALSVDLAISLMRAVSLLGERAARLPAGPSDPLCNAGLSFTTLRDAAPLAPGPAARRFFVERFDELANAAEAMPAEGDRRLARSATLLRDLARRAAAGFDPSMPVVTRSAAAPAASVVAASGDEDIGVAEGRAMTLRFDTGRCIHARLCVTGAPTVFLSGVQGAWLHPDRLDVERLAAVAQSCPSGAITYRRKDGGADEAAPPVNLAAVRENGPYAFRAAIRLAGADAGFRATLCRCGASANKPFCDGSHVKADFRATGEPPGPADASSREMLAVRDGPLDVDPQPDGPLAVRGNLEVISGTGRVVARMTTARLCRCGGSANKPFCDGSHARIGFRS